MILKQWQEIVRTFGKKHQNRYIYYSITIAFLRCLDSLDIICILYHLQIRQKVLKFMSTPAHYDAFAKERGLLEDTE